MFSTWTFVCVISYTNYFVSLQLLEKIYTVVDQIPFYADASDHEEFSQFDLISKGFKVGDTVDFQAEAAIKNETFCDVEKVAHNGKRAYLPSICVKLSDCDLAKGAETFVDSPCETQICCRVDKVGHLKKYTFTPFSEIPHDYKFHPKMSMTGQYQFKPLPSAPYNPYRQAWNVDNFNLTFMNMFPVCGMKRVSPSSYRFNLFFCVREDMCDTASQTSSNSEDEEFKAFGTRILNRTQQAWNTICENVALRHYYPSKSKKRVCCQSDKIPILKQHDSKINQDVDSFNFLPQIPLFLKYARGFRASYMCEHYGRVLCKEEDLESCEDKCPAEEKSTSSDFDWVKWIDDPNQLPGDIPHQALIGAYSQKFFLYFYCGGTLISRRWVLSVKRCKQLHGVEANLIMLGMFNISSSSKDNINEQVYFISQILTYPFDGRKLSAEDGLKSNLYDYALFKTNNYVIFSKFVRPACIYHTDPPQSYKEMFFTGFGTSTSLGNHKSELIKRIPFKHIYRSDDIFEVWRDKCSPHTYYDEEEDQFYGKYGVKQNHMICGSTVLPPFQQKKQIKTRYGSPCKYDEGGPLQFKVPLPYCIFEVFAVLSSKRKTCVDGERLSAFQTIKDIVYDIEEVVWKYPFLEDIERPILKKSDIKSDLLWFDECEDLAQCLIAEKKFQIALEEPPAVFFDDYQIPVVKNLNEGIKPTDIISETSLLPGKETLCDMERFESQDGIFKYTPSFCVKKEAGMCTRLSHIGRYSNASCTNQDGQSVCCPATSQTKFTEHVHKDQLLNLLTHRDPLGYKFNKDVGITSPTQATISDPEYQSLIRNDAQQLIQNEFVCGVKAIFDRNMSEFEYNAFFCTFPENCKRNLSPAVKKQRTPGVAWHEFCAENSWNPEGMKGKTTCCHPLDFGDASLPHTFPWNLQQLPVYLNYAPGVRAAWRCEEYSKYVCEMDQDKCVLDQGDSQRITRGEVPYMVQIGFIVPKYMLFYCGGAIVSSRYILSSESCSSKYQIDANTVLVGDFDINEVIDYPGWEKLYVIAEILSYPFERQKSTNPPAKFVDLALYRTNEDIQFSPRVRPACLYHRPLVVPDRAIFTGFGIDSATKKRPQFMKRILFNIDTDLQQENCSRPSSYNEHIDPYYSKNGAKEPHLFCISPNNPWGGPCKYDNGGPLQVQLQQPYCSRQIIGILSSGRIVCDDVFKPLVFVNVTKLILELENALWPIPFLDIDFRRPSCVESSPKDFDFLGAINVDK